MNLIIDVGNTRIKLGFFENKTLKNFFVITSVNELFNHSEFLSLLNQTHKVIISNVTNVELTEFFKKNCYNSPIIQLTSSIPLPFQIDYETPHTLGQDRLAAVAGAVSEFPNTNLLIIDFGTCIKYNVCSNNIFMGGAISPGLQMRYNALHHYTGKLPLLNYDNIQNIPDVVAKNSSDNLHSGVINGCIAEVNFFIDKMNHLYSNNLKIIFTGGDAIFFEKLSERKVLLRPYLILNGLNEILEYQSLH